MSKIRLGSTNSINFKNSIDLNRVFAPVVASVALTNLFANSSFEAATPNKIVYGTRTTGVAKTGTYSVMSGYDSTTDYNDPDTGDLMYRYYNNNHLTISLDNYTVGQKYSISFWYKGNASTLIVFGSVTPIAGGGTYAYYKVENLTATAGGTLAFSSGNSMDSPDVWYIDDVWLVAGATAY